MTKKKTLSFAVALLLSLSTFAQNQITIKAGTNVPVKSQNAVRAANVTEGQLIDFMVSRDVNVDGTTIIPYGSMVKGTVITAKKSSWWGTRGRLGITINNVVLPDGTEIPLTTNNIEIKGDNRTPLSVITFLFVWPCCFICGGKAEMPAGYEINAQVAAATTISTK